LILPHKMSSKYLKHRMSTIDAYSSTLKPTPFIAFPSQLWWLHSLCCIDQNLSLPWFLSFSHILHPIHLQILLSLPPSLLLPMSVAIALVWSLPPFHEILQWLANSPPAFYPCLSMACS
jgi:hypothetical protein